MSNEFLADFHLHSHYSMATSKYMTLPEIYRGAKIKGTTLIGTGDFTHPKWIQNIEQQLQPVGNGFFSLNNKLQEKITTDLPKQLQTEKVEFILSVEVNVQFNFQDKLRKIHCVICLPTLSAAKKLNQCFARWGNLSIDARPTLFVSLEKVIEAVFEIEPEALFIPAHVWTPWFGVFGSKSGFDSLEQAFGKHVDKISALETGLSSDPRMNRLIADFDNIALVSNSDAHSPQKLGREATIFNCQLSYQAVRAALVTNSQDLVGTIEFFPQEGKYHYDGHRKCGISFSPEESRKNNFICPKCGRKVTVGVEHRVQSLSTRKTSQVNKRVEYCIPLAELIAEVVGVKSITSKTVEKQYQKLVANLGTEFTILRSSTASEIAFYSSPELAQAITNMRKGRVKIEPGFDGQFGKVQALFQQTAQQQSSLF